MRKVAVFVEGQTELIFVRELLLKVFQYQDISIECFNLIADSNFQSTEYPFAYPESNYYFQIISVGNDKSVLTRMLSREKHMREAGFSRIIGLRDMYSEEYHKIVKSRKIVEEINQKFIDGHRQQLKLKDTFFSFAIMEVEAWLLGFRKIFERIDSRLTTEFVEQQLGFNIEKINPETYFFHPAVDLDGILKLVRMQYSKSKDDVNAIVGHIVREDYLDLLNSDKCASFKEFYNYLGIPSE